MALNHGEIRVVILDDHPVVRRRLEAHFSRSSDISVAIGLERSRDVFVRVWTKRTDVLHFDDFRGPDETGGLNVIQLADIRFPDGHLLMTSANDTPITISMAMRAGAYALVGNGQDLDELGHGVNRMAPGPSYPTAISTTQLSVAATPKCERPSSTAIEQDSVEEGGPRHQSPDLSLCPREHEVLRDRSASINITCITAKFSRTPKNSCTPRRSTFRKLEINSDVGRFAARKLPEDS